MQRHDPAPHLHRGNEHRAPDQPHRRVQDLHDGRGLDHRQSERKAGRSLVGPAGGGGSRIVKLRPGGLEGFEEGQIGGSGEGGGEERGDGEYEDVGPAKGAEGVVEDEIEVLGAEGRRGGRLGGGRRHGVGLV